MIKEIVGILLTIRHILVVKVQKKITEEINTNFHVKNYLEEEPIIIFCRFYMLVGSSKSEQWISKF